MVGRNSSGMPMQPGAGFNPNLGSVAEHLDENALKQLGGSQSTGAAGATTGSNSNNPMPAQRPPREVGTIPEEITRMGTDLTEGIKDVFSLATLLGIKPTELTPEQRTKLQQIHQNFNRFTEEEKAVAQQEFQRRMQERKAREEAEQRKKQEEQAAAQQYVVPSSPQKGPQGPAGSGKQKAQQLIQDRRTKLSGPSSAN